MCGLKGVCIFVQIIDHESQFVCPFSPLKTRFKNGKSNPFNFKGIYKRKERKKKNNKGTKATGGFIAV